MDFTTILLQWYHENARKLPWRETKDPYAIWVSEVMLQQTQVDTVIPYYLRFIEKFPTLTELAEADINEVVKAWEGLGYYRRVRLLHQGVREVTARFGGVVPDRPEELASLPGIGPYMVGSIASIAFNLPVAAVDGNVIRVVSRLLALEEDAALTPTRRKITAWVQERFSDGQAGDYTQALMELGALICTQNSRSAVDVQCKHYAGQCRPIRKVFRLKPRRQKFRRNGGLCWSSVGKTAGC